MPVIDHFKFIAPFYDQIFPAELDADRRKFFDVAPGMRVLDAGGGTGRIAERLLCSGCNLIIADESRGMLRQAITKIDLNPVNTLAEHLPFPPGRFDRVIMVDAFHHVMDQGYCVREMWRVLKPGGKIIIEEPDITQFPVKLVALAEKVLLMRSRFLPAEKISRLFRECDANITVHSMRPIIWVIVQKSTPV